MSNLCVDPASYGGKGLHRSRLADSISPIEPAILAATHLSAIPSAALVAPREDSLASLAA